MLDKEAKAIKRIAGSESTNERLTMTIPEFAAASGISKNLAYALAREDRLPVPVIHLGKRMVLSRRVVEKLLQDDGQGEG